MPSKHKKFLGRFLIALSLFLFAFVTYFAIYSKDIFLIIISVFMLGLIIHGFKASYYKRLWKGELM